MYKKSKKNLIERLPAWMVRWGINLWPPYYGTGIYVKKIQPDFLQIEVILKAHWYNRNYVGTHFGGSMFSMTDPFYMLMLIKNLGKEFIVWDKASSIQFKKPGKGLLKADFKFSSEEILKIREQARKEEKYIFDRSIDIIDESNEIVATVVKTLYVKQKRKLNPS